MDSDPNVEGNERHEEDPQNRGEGSHPPNDGQWVPLERAERMAHNAAERVRAEMEAKLAKVEAKVTAPQEPTEVVWTRPQLQAMVDEGKITEELRDQVLYEQAQKTIKADLHKEVFGELEKRDRERDVKAAIGQYTAQVPALLEHGSDERKRVEREFQRLIGQFGMSKDDLRTELLAITNVLGPAEALLSKGERSVETHQEVGGSSEESNSGSKSDSPPRNLTKREKAYYANQIDKGRYKDWAEVRKELEFASPVIRQRHGATA